MKRFTTVLTLLLCLAGPSVFAAGYANNTTVAYIRIDNNGKGVVFLNSPVSQPASCSITYYSNAMAFDTNTAGGKSTLSILIAAKSLGSVVTIQGAGTCNVYSGVEDIGSANG